MPLRVKFFLIFASVCISPLLIISITGFFNEERAIDRVVGQGLQDTLATTVRHSRQQLLRADEQLQAASGTKRLHAYVTVGKGSVIGKTRVVNPNDFTTGEPSSFGQPPADELTRFMESAGFCASVAVIDSHKRPLLTVDRNSEPAAKIAVTLKGDDYLPSRNEPDERVWTVSEAAPLCLVAFDAQLGDVRRCTVPIFLTDERDAKTPRGALVSSTRLDLLFSATAQDADLTAATSGFQPAGSQSLVLDGSGRIVYHTNDTLRHQPVSTAEPGLSPIAETAASGGRGVAHFKSSNGEDWLAAYEPFPLRLSLVQVGNLTHAHRSARIHLLWSLGLSLLLGFSVAVPLTAFYQRQKRSLDRVTKGAAAIAGGELDQKLDLLSRDDLRPLADSMNLMSDRLREQLAREAEAHQFQSFIKLSALLTHDLKNAIGALSLIVSNMERHFDKPEFRADALKNLAGAADKLRALVARLSNPVNTLSGEFRVPRPTDLVPLLQEVLKRHAEPDTGRLEVETRLPAALLAMADAERIERVIENLIINAIEALPERGGKLVITAGSMEQGTVFFSVTDSGPGMSGAFIKEKLFRPFATTKQRGVGLGLYTCREVVRANGGRIDVESVEGSGTTFRVVLASAS